MTIRIADVASYQGALSVAKLKAAGFDVLNFKISHGLTQRSVVPGIDSWINVARAAGRGVATFHFLDGSADGASQAGYAYARMLALGVASATAHQVDCESTATLQILVDYLAAMTRLLRRPVALYTGDWWWTAAGRRWNVVDLAPLLWAAPNAGYLPGYPGDDSPHWAAGYGGWTDLAVMQHTVASVAGVDVSQSAIRDPAVWAALTGKGDAMAWVLVPALVSLRAEFNEVAPDRDKSSDGSIGDPPHAQESSDHNPDETGKTPSEDADSVNEVHAIDVDQSGPWPDGFSMETAVRTIVARHKAGNDDRLQNVIYNRRIWSRSWGWTQHDYTGPNPHDKHAHFSARYTTTQEDDTRPWGLKELIGVSQADVIAALKSAEGKKAVYDAVNQDAVQRYVAGAPVPKDPAKPGDETMTWASALAYVNRDTDVLRRAVGQAQQTLTAAAASLTQLAGRDFVDEQAVVDGVLAGLGAGHSPDEVAAILRAVPGVDWAAVGAKLTGSA